MATKYGENIGDSGSAAELPEEIQIWEKVSVVDQAVKGKYFTFERALELYKLTKEEYNKFKNNE